MNKKKPTCIDLFAGCGGLSLGLHNAGWQGIFAVEKSTDAFKTLEYNLIDGNTGKQHFAWPKWLPQQAHDINEILENYKDQLLKLRGKVDLVAGGPPCQGFSMAGRRNEGDVRNKLIDSYIDFVQLVQPKIIFFENVKGFTQEFRKNKAKGKVYSTLVETKLKAAGYEIKGKLVNFAQYGVPQKRTRFILVGIKEDIAKKKKITAENFFAQLEANKYQFFKDNQLDPEPTVSQALSDLLKANGEQQTPDRPRFKSGLYAEPTTAYQRYMRMGISDKLPNSHSFPHHSKTIIDRFKYFIKLKQPSKNISEEIKLQLSLNKHVIIPLGANHQAPTITTLPDDYIHYSEPRILTVREYARLQSFPDWYSFQGKYTTGGILRKQQVPRYTQIGNAIPPLFGEQSGMVLKEFV
jgi:DNA (cytosine-5)-methyltransferase 1